MFKKFGTALLLAVGFLLPIQADAAEKTGVYVAPKFAVNVQHTKGDLSIANYGSIVSGSETDARAGGALAFGYDFASRHNMPIRAELEYGAYGNLSKTGTLAFNTTEADFELKVGVQTLLANMYWDITKWNNFTPYIGAGIGMAFIKTEGIAAAPEGSESMSDTKTVFAGQLGFGCSYAFNETAALDLGYRFLIMGSGKTEYSPLKLESKENHAHQFMLGLRMTF